MRARMRRAASIVLLALVFLPFSDAFGLARTRMQLWTKLRSRHRDAPDTGWDRYYSELKLYIPSRGRVGLVQIAPPGTPLQQREYYFLQYALAPRLLVSPGQNEEYVIACGPPAAAGNLLDLSKFVVVKQLESDFTVYRRVSR